MASGPSRDQGTGQRSARHASLGRHAGRSRPTSSYRTACRSPLGTSSLPRSIVHYTPRGIWSTPGREVDLQEVIEGRAALLEGVMVVGDHSWRCRCFSVTSLRRAQQVRSPRPRACAWELPLDDVAKAHEGLSDDPPRPASHRSRLVDQCRRERRSGLSGARARLRAMTLDVYADLFDDDLNAVSDRLDEAYERSSVGECGQTPLRDPLRQGDSPGSMRIAGPSEARRRWDLNPRSPNRALHLSRVVHSTGLCDVSRRQQHSR